MRGFFIAEPIAKSERVSDVNSDSASAVLSFRQQRFTANRFGRAGFLIVNIGVAGTDRDVLIIANVVLNDGTDRVIKLLRVTTVTCWIVVKFRLQVSHHACPEAMALIIPQCNKLQNLPFEY